MLKKVELQPIGWSLLSCLPQSWSSVSKLAGMFSERWEPLYMGGWASRGKQPAERAEEHRNGLCGAGGSYSLGVLFKKKDMDVSI